MSAYMVSDEHLVGLVNRAWWCDLLTEDPRRPGKYARIKDDYELAQVVLNALHKANVDSLIARYGKSKARLLGIGDPPKFELSLDRTPTPAAIASAVTCFAYQSCDVEGWRYTWAAEFCNRFNRILVRQLPGYYDTDWHIEEQA